MTNLQTWEQVREFYKEKFGIEPDLVELAADIDILRMCASGSSNKSISRFLELPEDDEIYQYIGNTLDRYFGFRGWATDLTINPLRMYKSGEYDYLDGVTQRVCEMFTILERSLNDKWI